MCFYLQTGTPKRSPPPFQPNPHLKFKKDLVDLQDIMLILSLLTCTKCKNLGVKLGDPKRVGLAFETSVYCPKCQWCVPLSNSTKKSYNIEGVGKQELYTLNIQAVVAARLARNGQACLQKFCTIMDMPKPPSRWAIHQKVAKTAFEKRSEQSMHTALQEELQTSDPLESQGLSASFDGSWMRRGFQSLTGFVVAMGLVTKKVLGFDVRHKYCPKCKGKTKFNLNAFKYFCFYRKRLCRLV